MTTRTDLAYAAGILDGEGCISIAYVRCSSKPDRYHVLNIHVSNTSPELLIWLRERFQGSVCRMSDNRKGKLGRRPIFQWQITAKQAHEFLVAVRPYLLVKAKQADVAIAFRKLKPTNRSERRNFLTPEIKQAREDCRLQIVELNHGRTA